MAMVQFWFTIVRLLVWNNSRHITDAAPFRLHLESVVIVDSGLSRNCKRRYLSLALIIETYSYLLCIKIIRKGNNR
jgi:hypothetical protein